MKNKFLLLVTIFFYLHNAFGQVKKVDIERNKYYVLGSVLNDEWGNSKTDSLSAYLKSNNIDCISAGSLGITISVMKKDYSDALFLLVQKWGMEYIELNIIQKADSVAKSELKKYNDLHPKMILEGQLSLDYYDKNLDLSQKNKYLFTIKYNYNRPIGGLVYFTSFNIEFNIDTGKTSFYEVE